MAARDKERYYWLKLDRGFFKRHDITVIEDMPNGKDYVLFYLKLMLESVDHEGALRFSDTIPYNEQMLASVTHTNVDIVRTALKILEELGMVEVFDDKTLFMTEVAKLLDSETYAARRKREAKNESGGNLPYSRGNFPLIGGNLAQEKEIEKEIDIEIDNSPSPTRAREEPTAADDTDLGLVIQAYENRLGRMPTALTIEEMKTYLHENGLSPEVISRAIDIACGEGIYKWSYVKGVMDRYITAGAKTINAAMIADENYRKRRKPIATEPAPDPSKDEMLRKANAALMAELGIDDE